MTLLDDITASVSTARAWLGGRRPRTAIVLGSGLTAVLAHLRAANALPYAELPDFPTTGVSGHTGMLHCGELFDEPVLVFEGRYHVYEGYSAWQVSAPVRLAAELGCLRVLLTNAAGGIRPEFHAGDFMLVTDHLNMTGMNPLHGRPERKFLDLCGLYRQDFHPRAQKELAKLDIRLHQGVLAWMLGPSYETPAEIRMLTALGADAVSMSTIPEAIVAKHSGLTVMALSFISNLAAGRDGQPLNHLDVLASGQRTASAFESLLTVLFRTLNNLK